MVCESGKSKELTPQFWYYRTTPQLSLSFGAISLRRLKQGGKRRRGGFKERGKTTATVVRHRANIKRGRISNN
jgi:hypothetical protein